MRCFPLKRTYVAGRIKKTRKEFLFYLLSCLQFIDGMHYLALICFLSVHRHFSDQCSHYCRITVNRFSNKYPSYNSISNCLNIFLSPTFFVNFANRLTSKTHWLPRVKYRQFFCQQPELGAQENFCDNVVGSKSCCFILFKKHFPVCELVPAKLSFTAAFTIHIPPLLPNASKYSGICMFFANYLLDHFTGKITQTSKVCKILLANFRIFAKISRNFNGNFAKLFHENLLF